MQQTQCCGCLLIAIIGWMGMPHALAEESKRNEKKGNSAAQSENKGRLGQYRCTTGNPKYAYWVCVPKSYSDENPAGLHLHFHGMSDQLSAQSFTRWAPFIEAQNLIGINVEFSDMKLGGDISDIEGKVQTTLLIWP